MNIMVFIGISLVIVSITLMISGDCREKYDLNKRISVLEAKVAVLLEERNK